jgi:uncharacterized DUF497 family protein
MGFEWDQAKASANVEKHGIDFDYAIRIFDSPLLERDDERKDYGEVRTIAAGQVENRVLVMIYTKRGENRRIISARSANQYEREAYYRALPNLASGDRQN